jgi:hypothetical protein
MTRKLRKLATSLVLQVFYDCTETRLKSLKFSDLSNLISLESQQPGQLQKVVTPKPHTVSRCANNRWKDGKIFYIFYVEFQVRFRVKGHQILKFGNTV